jgi:hypothetical protein
MNNEVRKFKHQVSHLKHDEQFLLLQKQDTELLRNTLLDVSSARDFYIEEQQKRDNDDYLGLIIETTYLWATITTILRGRGAYGKMNRCFYCGKHFQPGEFVTSDEFENVCHIECADTKLEK